MNPVEAEAGNGQAVAAARTRAHARAYRHSGRVRTMRRLIPVVAGGAVALLLGFGGWYAARIVALWRGRHGLPGYVPAAFAALAVIALHSLVDYPARTAALAAVAAMCIGMISRPQSAVDADD